LIEILQVTESFFPKPFEAAYRGKAEIMMATIQKSDIEWLAANRPRDLHDLLMGTSVYTQDVSDSFSECDDESD